MSEVDENIEDKEEYLERISLDNEEVDYEDIEKVKVFANVDEDYVTYYILPPGEDVKYIFEIRNSDHLPIRKFYNIKSYTDWVQKSEIEVVESRFNYNVK